MKKTKTKKKTAPQTKKAPANTTNNPAQENKWVFWMYILAGVLVGLIIFAWATAEKDISNAETNETICIAENSVFYGAEWCGYCQMQKEMFGDNADLLNYVDCEVDGEVCIAAGIQVFPTWDIKGERYTGLQSLDKLKELTGC